MPVGPAAPVFVSTSTSPLSRTWDILLTAGLALSPEATPAMLDRARTAVELADTALAPSTQRQYGAVERAVRAVHPDLLPMDNPQKVMIFFIEFKGRKWSAVETAQKAIAAHHRYAP